jgi:hypothetical protein
MSRLGRAVCGDARAYLVGGATAVLLGWRESTIDVDLKIVPERDDFFRALPELKEELRLNIELASPDQFIPPLPGWEERSLPIGREGAVEWFHYDPYAQALAKIERGHERDREDVRKMLAQGFVEPSLLRELFARIEPDLIRYPALDPPSFRAKLEEALGKG